MRALFVAIFPLVALVSHPASAGDGKGYFPATSCLTSGGTVNINSSGKLFNSSSSASMTVYCGLVIDTGEAFDFTSTEVWMHDQTTAAAVSCTQYSRYQSSTSVTTTSATLSYPSGSGSTTAYSSSSPTLLSTSSGSGFAYSSTAPYWNYIQCTLPATGSGQNGLVMILAEEG